MQFRPCIDLHGGKVKQIVGSTLTDDDSSLTTNFESGHDSAFYAELYRRDQLDGGHIIMLGAGNEEAARRALDAWPGHLQVGGGIRAGNAAEWLDRGASQVILTSYIFADGELKRDNLQEIFRIAGRERLVLDLSCRKREDGYYIVTDRWQKFTRCKIDQELLRFLADYCTEFLIHAVDVEGKQAGIDTTLLRQMAEYSPIDCVYAGGIRTLEDIEQIRQAGHGKIHFTVGSALNLFGGPLAYSAVVQATRQER